MAGTGRRLSPVKNRTPRVTLYSTRQCPHCRRAKALLQRLGIPFTEYDVERNRRAFIEFQRVGGRGVPLITIGGRRLDHSRTEALKRALVEAEFRV